MRKTKFKGAMTMSYFEEDFYSEPSEFEMQIEDFKQSLLKSVKSEFIAEMDRLRAENAELQAVKKNFEQIKNEYRAKERQLEFDRQDLQRKVRYERFSELMKSFHIHAYLARSKRVQLPKCDKCNERRKITFHSPTGKLMEEECECSIGKVIYDPEEYEVSEFTAEKGDNKMRVWYHRRYEDSEHFSSTHYADCIYQPGTPFEEIKNNWKTFFTSKEECQAYCDWLNEKSEQPKEAQR